MARTFKQTVLLFGYRRERIFQLLYWNIVTRFVPPLLSELQFPWPGQALPWTRPLLLYSVSRNPPLCVVGHQAPDEAGQLSRYGGYRHISLLLSMEKTIIFATKPFVRLIGIGYNLLTAPRLTGFQLL